MNDNGYSTVETALVFPVFLLLVISMVFILVSYALSEKAGYSNDDTFIHRVYITDTIKRKAAMIGDALE